MRLCEGEVQCLHVRVVNRRHHTLHINLVAAERDVGRAKQVTERLRESNLRCAATTTQRSRAHGHAVIRRRAKPGQCRGLHHDQRITAAIGCRFDGQRTLAIRKECLCVSHNGVIQMRGAVLHVCLQPPVYQQNTLYARERVTRPVRIHLLSVVTLGPQRLHIEVPDIQVPR